jgi:1,5-anhydro-D-fructose reductase (1,5-anhydro-D-mannitol-forming)
LRQARSATRGALAPAEIVGKASWMWRAVPSPGDRLEPPAAGRHGARAPRPLPHPAARRSVASSAAMKDTIRWGILGCGDVTEVKSGPALAQAEGSTLVAVMRRTPHLAEDYARRHGVPRWYASASELIHDPEVDAVYVATPPGAHEELALAVAAAGKPAYVEKPMARSHAECARMVDAFAAAGLPLFVAYYRRALPRFEQVRALLAEGRIGRPTSLVYRYVHTRRRPPGDWRLDPAVAGGGLFLDLGSHALDLFDWLLGPLGEVAGSAARERDPRES